MPKRPATRPPRPSPPPPPPSPELLEARDITTPVTRLEALLEKHGGLIDQALAANPNSSLFILARTVFTNVEEVEANPAWALFRLAGPSNEEEGRWFNGIHQNLSMRGRDPEQLTFYALSDRDDFRSRAAGNRNTPHELLQRLATDTAWWVRQAVAANQAAPPELLRSLSLDRKDGVRRVVANNAATPEDVLVALADDAAEDVRVGVAGRMDAPQSVIETLKKDRSPDVARRAKWTAEAHGWDKATKRGKTAEEVAKRLHRP